MMKSLVPWAVAVLLFVSAGWACSRHVPHEAATPKQGAAATKDVAYDEAPILKNRDDALRMIARHYPEDLKNAGIGGEVLVHLFVDVDGRVKDTKIYRSSGSEALDQAAMVAAREFEFIPARLDGERIAVWIYIPISFAVSRR
jgi:TonB family protein